MTITFHSERWSQYYNDPDLPGLWAEHYSEFVPVHRWGLPFGPDLKTYPALEAAGQLEIVVARKEGKMVGYCLLVVKRHLHYNALCAFEDSYFLTKPERLGGAGTALIQKARSVAKQRGCTVGYWMTKEFLPMTRLFERLGMVRTDSVFMDWLKE